MKRRVIKEPLNKRDKKRQPYSEVRCLNCLERFGVPHEVERATCTKCKMQWRISWLDSHTAKIRGPVWSKMPR